MAAGKVTEIAAPDEKDEVAEFVASHLRQEERETTEIFKEGDEGRFVGDESNAEEVYNPIRFVKAEEVNIPIRAVKAEMNSPDWAVKGCKEDVKKREKTGPGCSEEMMGKKKIKIEQI
ncbi:SWAP (Suppressor-of-White-APricot)/surpdomain-containing protein / D111/G-patch domain-containing protein [Striga asiatica]|uniref:SWAP (Suppressor-of-White-APricot)/surpdomain-containing protein / D111/G-patch domain-containing protein n=1 Tax=Striga asiatica TaxID=4170 RepID=A0A5A7PWN2_STRAF|nr:SWAP (Suppressor-of-White-APricot)/surpdomain-containing protein / D111/G-patch domain-containing protein [Striga asiatica]